ncbi:hypothetical protein U0070_018008 [Myodes glareolus]|uniref:Uncharacterized protein n=1 Tax=Myodes glareolus TaxID=447135 RepID=A0AAW0HWE1_MYOGA
MADIDKLNIDSIIQRLLEGCGKLLLSGKMLGVQMTMDSTLIDLGFISSGLLTVEFSVELL